VKLKRKQEEQTTTIPKNKTTEKNEREKDEKTKKTCYRGRKERALIFNSLTKIR